MPDLYEPAYVRNLFNEMASTYGPMNLITSFGFAALWRRQCLGSVPVPRGATVLDLMTGMGELCPSLGRRIGPGGKILAIDISPVMCDRARRHAARFPVDVLEADALHAPLPDACADLVVSSFGLKTFSPDQTRQLAAEVHRLLKPGGHFSFIEISVPRAAVLRVPYQFYISVIIPLIGRVLLKNPDCYRMLGIYTANFQNASAAAQAFAAKGLSVEPTSLFFGCATGFTGSKRAESAGHPDSSSTPPPGSVS